ncbi:lytic transglycosylase domain-containing protein [Corallococcus sp. Z5C101001]|uniref:lytic transglycosylase domain-containing protein n=1 Tax=Corallococcus sp. Z5C101001 TaxID=2596829 RepID=UPI00117C1713|nr:lytic transglycosylase domain-containing protein [Corallococcus sp. Z5C101001]TSC20373.1 tetratricopeptide repeat protein [Corallococcus sp. Z5C101001]
MSWTGWVAGWVTGVALGQSPTTLEAVRLHRPDAAALVQAELSACEAAKCPDAGRLGLLAGTLVLSDGDAPLARDLLTRHAAPPPLEAFQAFYLGQARFYAGDPDGAAKDFERSLEKASPALAVRARARLGESLLDAHRPKDAAPVLESAAAAQPTAELLFQRAATREATHNTAGAKADLKAVALRFPTHPYADEALEKLAALKPAVKLTLPEHLQRARGFLSDGAPVRAEEELATAEKRALVKGAPAQAQVALLRAQVFFARGKREEAEKALAVARKGPPAIAAEAALVVARRALRSDDNDKARKLMAALDKAYPSQAAGEEGAFFAAWLDLQGSRFEDATRSFADYEKRYKGSRRRDEAMWFRALAHIRLEQYPQARQALDALVTDFPKTSLAPQARYWMARTDELAGAKAATLGPAYEAVISAAPASFYALLAAERLRELGRTPPAAFPQPPKQLTLPRPPELELAVALTRAGLFRDAADEVQSRVSGLRTADQALPFAHALLQLGEYGHAHVVAARYLWGRAFGAKAPDALAAFYPRAFAQAVEAEATRQALDPFLVWAIMRRESAFRPEVMSAADARGLMQIIPPTATEIAQKMAEPAPAPADLFAPERNIRYGAWYLAQLMKRFAHPALAAAAYNAGPKAAVRWTQERGSMPLDLFVESIPYRETRGYVKQVVADLYLYHRFYEKEGTQSRLAMTVPSPSTEGVSF